MAETRFILGNAIQDTSAALRKSVIECADKGEKVILLVPDQFEYETELALFRECKTLGKTTLIPKIRVRTFSKLADEILSVYQSTLEPANETTKLLYMYRAVRECVKDGDGLSAFKRAAEKPGFAAKMLQTISMLKIADISSEEYASRLEAHSEDFRDTNPMLFNKLRDIAKIYREYNSYFTENHTDRLDSTSVAASLAAENRYFSGYSVFVDGFTGFTANQHRFIQSIISSAERSVFSFMSEYNSDRVVFKAVNDEIALIADYAKDVCGNSVIGLDSVISGNERIHSDGIKAIADSLYERTASYNSTEDVKIIKADSVYNELDYAAAEIKRLITEEGYRCRDIAVVTPSPNEYKSALESVFDKYEIKLFCDIPTTIRHLPLVNLTCTLLDLMSSFTSDNLLSYIKTGFVQIPDYDGKSTHCIRFDEINAFEEYLLHWNVRASELAQPFPENTREKAAERVRSAVMDGLISLRSALTEKDQYGNTHRTGAEITKLITDFLLNTVNIDKAIAARCKNPGSESLSDTDSELVFSYQTLWNTMLDIFEAMYKGLGDCRMPVSQYRDLLREIFTNTMLAKPPQVRDAVLAGDITRTRTIGIRAVFIVGASLGVFPNENAASGVFSEFETELLNECDLPIAKTRENLYYSSRYEVYRALTLASDRLYLSCPSMDNSCARLTPCEPIAEVAKLCSVTPITAEKLDYMFYCRSLRSAQQQYAAICRQSSQQSANLRAALEKAGSVDFIRRLDSAADSIIKNGDNTIDIRYIDSILNDTISATNVEKAIKCPLNYYLEKVLKIKGRETVDYTSSAVGIAVHYVMQRVLEEYKDKDSDFIALSADQLHSKALSILREYLAEKMGGELGKNNRFRYLYSNLTDGASELLWIHQKEFEQRRYRPIMFEAKLTADAQNAAQTPVNSAALKVDIGSRTLNIDGVVDRVDTFTFNYNSAYDTHKNEPEGPDRDKAKEDEKNLLLPYENNRYLRIVDYKTGGTTFDIRDAVCGINIQMLLYLFALCDANPDYKPGAVTYCPSAASGAKDKKKAPSATAVRLEKHLQSGMYFIDPATGNELTGYAEGISELSKDSIPASIISMADKPEHIPAASEYTKIKDAVLSAVKSVLTEIYDGHIVAAPFIGSKQQEDISSPCSYCVYSPICSKKDCIRKASPDVYDSVIWQSADTDGANPSDTDSTDDSSDESTQSETKKPDLTKKSDIAISNIKESDNG
ncbi:MAG: PD-(D/E)XK nuclease family protein [Oscillospiraceae bacterium]